MDLGVAPLATGHLDAREAALAHAIYDALARRWLTIEAVAGALAGRPIADLDPAARAAVVVGGAQLLFLERLPAHAVVNEAVAYARSAGGSKAAGRAGLVNAVLRRLAEAAADATPTEAPPPDADRAPALDRGSLPLDDGRLLRFSRPVLPEEPVERLAAGVGLPAELLSRWWSAFGEGRAERLAWHTLCRPPVVINAAHAHAPVQPPPGQHLTPHERAGMLVLGPPGASPRALLRGRQDVWAQDAASASALDALERPEAGHLRGRPCLVVDLCAGLGTKTRQLAAALPEATVLACDTNAARARTLAGVFAGHDRVAVRTPEDVRRQAAARADLVLLDVPCSNSGVLARRPEARYRLGGAQLDRLTAIQRDLLAAARALLAPGGLVLYATCSIEPAENDAMVRWASEHAGYRTLWRATIEPRGHPGAAPMAYRDGAYAALLAAPPPP